MSSQNARPPRPPAEGETRTRRTFSREEKLRILDEAAKCGRGELGAVLRKYGIYSSHLVSWRKVLREHGREGIGTAKRGPKTAKDGKDARIEELERKLAKAEKKLALADAVIAFQKKAVSMLDALEASRSSDKDDER